MLSGYAFETFVSSSLVSHDTGKVESRLISCPIFFLIPQSSSFNIVLASLRAHTDVLGLICPSFPWSTHTCTFPDELKSKWPLRTNPFPFKSRCGKKWAGAAVQRKGRRADGTVTAVSGEWSATMWCVRHRPGQVTPFSESHDTGFFNQALLTSGSTVTTNPIFSGCQAACTAAVARDVLTRCAKRQRTLRPDAGDEDGIIFPVPLTVWAEYTATNRWSTQTYEAPGLWRRFPHAACDIRARG